MFEIHTYLMHWACSIRNKAITPHGRLQFILAKVLTPVLKTNLPGCFGGILADQLSDSEGM